MNRPARRLRRRDWFGKRFIGAVLVVIAVGATGSLIYGSLWGHVSVPKYRVAQVERGALAATVATSGTVSAVMSVQVGSLVSGRLKEIFVDFNSIVKKNDLLARIDPESFEAKVTQARAQLESAQAEALNQEAVVERARVEVASARATLVGTRAQIADARAQAREMEQQLKRRAQLAQRELIAQSELETARAAFESADAKLQAAEAQAQVHTESIRAAEAQLKVAHARLQAARAQINEKRAMLRQAEVDLQNTRIVAPVDGIVVARHVDIGETMAAVLQSPILFTIARDLTNMQVNANVDEADIGYVKVGQNATFTVGAFRTETFAGEVTQIRKAAQVAQGVVTYVTVISARNRDMKLLPGMTATIQIVVDRVERALRIPNAALRFSPAEPAGENPAGNAVAAEPRRPDRPRDEGRGRGTVGRIWILDAAGKPHSVPVRVGITDGTYSELLDGDLATGQEVVVGVTESPDMGRRQRSPRLI